jgi:large subunit ribosomal protein L27e
LSPSLSPHRFKSGKVVIVLSGRYAGRKAIVVKASDEGNAEKKYGHALVAGIDRYPRKIVKAMKKSKQDKRTKVKPFVKSLNYNHIMPTRYSVDFDLKKEDVKTGAESIKDTRKSLKKLFEDRFKNQKDPKVDRKAAGAGYFFTKLRF